MQALKLYIVYEPDGDPPVTLARLCARAPLVEAARAAIKASAERAETAKSEPMVQLRRDEAHRLRRSLELLLPELRKWAD